MAVKYRNHPPADSEFEFEDDDGYGAQEGYGQTPGRNATRQLVFDLLGRWYWVALGLVLGLLAAAYYLSKTPPSYTATSTLLVKQQTSGVISKDQVDEIDMRSAEGMNTVAARIQRPELLERVGSRVDVRALPGLIPPPVDWTPQWLQKGEETPKSPDLPTPAALGSRIGSWLTVSIQRGTRLMDISIAHQVPEVAKALADAVAREYLAEIAGAASEGRSTKSDALLRQSEEARKKLQESERALANYSRALELHKVLEEREHEVDQLARRYRAKHPKMIAGKAELEAAKSRFLAEFEVARNSAADAPYWATVKEELNASTDDGEAHLRVARQLLLSRASVLDGETKSQMSVFNALLTSIQESNINREGDESSAEMSSFARLPGRPSAPVPGKIYAMGAAGGIACGLGLAFLLVRLDNKYHSVAQVELETGLPVLAAISQLSLRALDQAVRHAEKREGELVVGKQQLDWDPRLVFRPGTTQTNYAEMFRILRASVVLLGDERKRKVTLFSSSLPGEGKSMVATNFAIGSAGQDRKTLLIDLDLRKPSVHRLFGWKREEIRSGITSLLAEQASFDEVVTTEVGTENLHVIFAGEKAPNPGELLNGEKLRALLEEARKRYDVVVIDSAPLLAVPDTRIIAPLVDNFCLIVRSDYVPRGAVLRTLELLQTSSSSPAGIVFNGFRDSRRMVGHNYSYGRYRVGYYGFRYGHGGYSAYGAYGAEEEDEKKLEKRRRRRAYKNRIAPLPEAGETEEDTKSGSSAGDSLAS